jgi:hypothetical protein
MGRKKKVEAQVAVIQAAQEAQVQAEDVSRGMFLEELKAARERAGSAGNLSIATGYLERRLAWWLVGKGPTWKIMQEAYFKLKAVPETVKKKLMGVYTTIIDAEGRGIQIKTGDDSCEHFWHDEEMSVKDGVWGGCLDSHRYEKYSGGIISVCLEIVNAIDNTSEAIAGFILEQRASQLSEGMNKAGQFLALDQFIKVYGSLPDIEAEGFGLAELAEYLAKKHGVENQW